MMRLSRKGAAFLRLHEGFRSKAYFDPGGVLTIGVGMTWRSKAFRDWWRAWKTGVLEADSTMTEDEADDALQFMVAREYGKSVNDFLAHEVVPQHVFDAMVSAVYNLGPGALKWKWAAAVKAGDYKLAASYLRKTGTTAGGKTLAGLVRRRKEEALLIEKGVYTGVAESPAAATQKPATREEPIQAPATPVPAVLPWWKRLFGLR